MMAEKQHEVKLLKLTHSVNFHLIRQFGYCVKYCLTVSHPKCKGNFHQTSFLVSALEAHFSQPLNSKILSQNVPRELAFDQSTLDLISHRYLPT